MAHGKNWRTFPSHIANEFLRLFDPFAHAITTIDSEHRQIHDGMVFTFTEVFTGLTSGSSKDYLINVPVSCFPHFRKLAFSMSDGPITSYLYRGTTVSAAGNARTFINNNLNSATLMSCVLTEGPTITDIGTEVVIDKKYSAAGAPPGQSGPTGKEDVDAEWVMAPGELYLLRLTNNSAGTIEGHVHMVGYELSYINE